MLILPLLLQFSKFHWKVMLCYWFNDLCTFKQFKKFSFIHLLYTSPRLSAFHLSVTLFWFSDSIHLVLFFFLSLTVSLCKWNSAASLSSTHYLTSYLPCLFLFMPALFMWFLIIIVLLTPITHHSLFLLTPFHINFLSLSYTLGSFPHLTWLFQRKTETATPSAVGRSLSATCYSSIFCSCA